MEKINKKLLPESKINIVLKSLSLLDSYKIDFQDYYDEYSQYKTSNTYDTENTKITNEDNVKLQVEGFRDLYVDFLDELYSLINIDIAKYCDNDNMSFLYKVNIYNILEEGNIYTHEKVLKRDEIDDLNINPYNFLRKKLNEIYNEHKMNFEEIFSKDGSILDLGDQVKNILRKDFTNDILVGFLSVIDLAEFELLELSKFQEKSNEFKNKFLDLSNSDTNNEQIFNRDKILGYFEVQISIYIDYFANKLNSNDFYSFGRNINITALKNYLNSNNVDDYLTVEEKKILYELINRKIDIEMLYDSLIFHKSSKGDFLYNQLDMVSGFAKNSINTIPDFKGLSSILEGDKDLSIKYVTEVEKILK